MFQSVSKWRIPVGLSMMNRYQVKSILVDSPGPSLKQLPIARRAHVGTQMSR